jgi:hypothetical protein
MNSLTRTGHEHHDRLLPSVDRLPVLAGMIGCDQYAEFRAGFEEVHAVVVGRLLPHIEAIERTLYGELERLMEGRHSMAPMRAEHAELRRLIATLGDFRPLLAKGCLSPVDGMSLRRVLYRLYTILKVHLAEEELYLGVLEQNLSAEEKDVLARGMDHAEAEPV